MRHNINAVSYLIGSFNNLINSFGQKPESVAFFKNQSQGIVELGQISQDDLDLVYKILGMQNTENVKWSITMPRLQKFIEAMNYMISCDVDNQRARCLLKLMQAGKVDNTLADLIDEMYDGKLLGKNFNLESIKSNKFGTFGLIGNNNKKTNYKKPVNIDKGIAIDIVLQSKLAAVKSSKDVLSEIANTLDSIGLGEIAFILLRDAKENREIHIANCECACSCDPRYYNVSIRDLLGLNIKYPNVYKQSLIKAIKSGKFYINERIKQLGDTIGIKESTENWMRADTSEMTQVIEILIEANKAIKNR